MNPGLIANSLPPGFRGTSTAVPNAIAGRALGFALADTMRRLGKLDWTTGPARGDTLTATLIIRGSIPRLARYPRQMAAGEIVEVR